MMAVRIMLRDSNANPISAVSPADILLTLYRNVKVKSWPTSPYLTKEKGAILKAELVGTIADKKNFGIS